MVVSWYVVFTFEYVFTAGCFCVFCSRAYVRTRYHRVDIEEMIDLS